MNHYFSAERLEECRWLSRGTEELILALLLYCREFGMSMSNSFKEKVSPIYWDKMFFLFIRIDIKLYLVLGITSDSSPIIQINKSKSVKCFPFHFQIRKSKEISLAQMNLNLERLNRFLFPKGIIFIKQVN